MLADSHCHFETKESAAEIIARAQQVGVEYILDAGDNLTHLAEHLDMVQGYPTVYTAAGAHPHQALEFSDLTAEGIVEAATHEKVIAIGEAGLDYFYDFAPREAQIRLFKENIKAAQQTGLPLIIHNRNSDEDMIELLQKAYQQKEFKAVIHCYSSSWALAEAALEMGFYISASGMITFPKMQKLRDNFAKVPLERLLVETDAPYLAPVPKRGEVNESANVVLTAQKLAEIKGVSFEVISDVTTANFRRLFGV